VSEDIGDHGERVGTRFYQRAAVAGRDAADRDDRDAQSLCAAQQRWSPRAARPGLVSDE
jgi:hypothetical protein